jgi:hypothetical protein
MRREHVVATSAAHILQFSTTLIHVSCSYRIARGPKSLRSPVGRLVHGETLGFGGPVVTVELLRLQFPVRHRPNL